MKQAERLIKASQTPLLVKQVCLCVCVQSWKCWDCLEMNVPSSTFVQWLIGEPPCGLEQMSAQAWHHSGKSGVFYTTYVGKKWARFKISQFCENFEGSIHLCFHSAACLQGTAAHTQVLLWCGANSGKLASCSHVVHTEPVHLGLSLFCCGAVCLQEKVHQSV